MFEIKSISQINEGSIKSIFISTYFLNDNHELTLNCLAKNFLFFDEDGFLKKEIEIHMPSHNIICYHWLNVRRENILFQYKLLGDAVKELTICTLNHIGKVIKKERFSSMYSLLDTTYLKYTATNQIEEEICMDSKNILEYKYTIHFGSEDHMTEAEMQLLKHNYKVEFNYEGENIIKESGVIDTNTFYEFIFDKFDLKGNWLHKILTVKNNKPILKVRKLEYYK